MATVVLLGTLDTKGKEYDYLRDRLREQDVDVLVVDAGVFEPLAKADVTQQEVAAAAGADVSALAEAHDRGAAVDAMCRGSAEIRKVFHKLGLDDVETSSQTLSGFLAEQLGSVPSAGAYVDFRGFRFLVTKANNRRAERVRIVARKPEEEQAADGA